MVTGSCRSKNKLQGLLGNWTNGNVNTYVLLFRENTTKQLHQMVNNFVEFLSMIERTAQFLERKSVPLCIQNLIRVWEWILFTQRQTDYKTALTWTPDSGDFLIISYNKACICLAELWTKNTGYIKLQGFQGWTLMIPFKFCRLRY